MLIKGLIDRWQNRHTLGDSRLDRHQLEFLPAALEIKERPPNPLGRKVGWSLITLFTIGVIWACIGEVNIVAVAEGKIVPSGQVKQIQPYERGVVAQILVEEGQMVKQGEPLIEFEQTLTFADQQRLEQEMLRNRLNQIRLNAYIRYLTEEGINAPIAWPEKSSDLHRQYHQSLLQQDKDAFSAEQARIVQQLAEKSAEQQINATSIAKLERTLPLISERVSALNQLMQKQMAAKAEYLELEQERIEQEQDLIAARARVGQLNAQVQELQQQRRGLLARARSETLRQLVELESQYASLQEELNKARDLNKKQILSAPVDGVVQELAIHTIGGVVTPAQPLMKIVPENQQLVVEAWLENKDIGFVRAEQPAEVKIHTFPFTKYGVIDATVDKVSTDATVDETRGLIYKAKVILEKNNLMVDGRNVDLVPGMGVSAEIKIGKRYLIEYVMAPLIRYKDESMGER